MGRGIGWGFLRRMPFIKGQLMISVGGRNFWLLLSAIKAGIGAAVGLVNMFFMLDAV